MANRFATEWADAMWNYVEDPDWSERLWVERRFQQQKVGNAVRRRDPEAVTQAVNAYRFMCLLTTVGMFGPMRTRHHRGEP